MAALAQAPPDPAWVNDGPGSDIDYWASTSTFQGNWAAVAFDPAALQTRYNWRITVSADTPDGPIAEGDGFSTGTSSGSCRACSASKGIRRELPPDGASCEKRRFSFREARLRVSTRR